MEYSELLELLEYSVIIHIEVINLETFLVNYLRKSTYSFLTNTC